jgi:hypothetical protein
MMAGRGGFADAILTAAIGRRMWRRRRGRHPQTHDRQSL